MKMKSLKSGDKVAIVSLSNGILGEPFVKHELDRGTLRVKEFGLTPVFMKNSLSGMETLKNHPELRASDLIDAFEDESVSAIISAIGGNDAYKIIPHLMDSGKLAEAVKKNPKIFMGYSDTTTIHLLLSSLGLSTFYGPAFITDFAEFENEMLPYTKSSLDLLFNPKDNIVVHPSKYWYKERTDFSPAAVGTPREKFEEQRGYELLAGSGKVRGKLYGGCLDIISSIAAAEFTPESYNEEENCYPKDAVEVFSKYRILPEPEELKGKILFLETSDSKMSPELFKKKISLLKKTHHLENISGLIFGKPMDEAYYENYKQILTDELSGYGYPILYNLNFGHSFPRMTLPYGATAEIDAKEKSLSIISLTDIIGETL